MAVGDLKERGAGQHNDVNLNPEEIAAFNQMAASAEEEQLRAHSSQQEAQQTGTTYTPSSNTYDDNGYSSSNAGGRHGGMTRRDPDVHGGFTRRSKDDQDNHAGFTRRDLRNAEEQGGKKSDGGESNPVANLMNKESGNNTPFSYNQGGGPKWAGARTFMQKHKKKVLASALASIGVLPLLALLLFILGALKIPHFAENVAAWRFAKVARQYRASMTNVMGEKAAYDSLTDEEKAKAQTKYGKYAVFDKVNRLRPNRVIQNLHANDRLQYNYKTTLLGRQKLTSITIASGDDLKAKTTIEIPTSRFKTMFENPLKRMDRYKDISTALNAAMKAHDPKISMVTRTAVTKAVLAKAGARLSGMAASKYLGQATQTEELNRLYTSMTENAKKFNELAKQYNEVAKKWDDTFTKAEQTQKEWPILMKKLSESQAALDKLTSAPLPKADSPTELNRLLNEQWDATQKAWADFDTARAAVEGNEAAYSQLIDETKTLREQMNSLSKQKLALLDERNKLATDFESKGGTISDRDAKIAIQQESYERAHRNGGINGIVDDRLKQVATEVDEAQEKAMGDKEQVGQMVDKGQDIPDAASQALERGMQPGQLRALTEKIVGFANPIYDIAVPICLAYEGSRISGDSIDADHDAKVSEAAYVLSTADQLENGTTMST
ncbi:MAG TPA: hypothetical protein VLA92_03485, partial [Candidatus Saccharimonadales bacterium]|nr:hypothetical protein [Candidatus Saccharimonadales bacterium]